MADKSPAIRAFSDSTSETRRLVHTTHQRILRCCSVENRKIVEVEALEESDAKSNLLQILKSGKQFSQTAHHSRQPNFDALLANRWQRAF